MYILTCVKSMRIFKGFLVMQDLRVFRGICINANKYHSYIQDVKEVVPHTLLFNSSKRGFSEPSKILGKYFRGSKLFSKNLQLRYNNYIKRKI